MAATNIKLNWHELVIVEEFMHKIKNPKIGEYVLVSKWSDKDPHDPWYVGFIEEVIKAESDRYYKVKESPFMWRHCWRITADEGKQIIETYPIIETGKPLNNIKQVIV